MKRLILSICPLLVCLSAYAQKENNVWTPGYNVKLNFNTPIPTQSACPYIGEGNCAVSSRTTGELLFFSNGIKAWDKNNNLMPNGSGLIGGGANSQSNSTMQAALIVPFMDDTSKYYLFTLQASDDPMGSTPGELHYSVVDMTLNGGLGDIVPTQKNIYVDDSLSEGMVAIRGQGCTIWVVTHSRHTNEYRAFEVSSLGVNTNAVVTTLPPILFPVYLWWPFIPYNFSTLKASPNDDRICLTVQGYALLSDFDKTTGQLSNEFVVDSFLQGVSCPVWHSCFSPDGNLLYVTEQADTSFEGAIFQYDLTSNNSTTIFNSKTLIDTGRWMDIQRLDDELYVFNHFTNNNKMGKINDPDVLGTGCNFDPNYLSIGNSYIINTVQNLVLTAYADTSYTSMDTNICTPSFPLSGRNNAVDYYWSTGAVTQTITANGPGTYWVISQMACNTLIDTFEIITDPDTLTSSKDTSVCNSQAILLKGRSNADSWLWNTGNTGQQQTISTQGIYWVYSALGCNMYLDSFVVDTSSFTFSLGPDTVLCNEATIVFMTNVIGSYIWQDGSIGSSYTASSAGTYSLTVNKNGCIAKDTVVVTQQTVQTSLHDQQICEGTSTTIDVTMPGATYLWQDGSTSGVYTASDSGYYLVEVSIGSCSDTAGFRLRYYPNWADSIFGGNASICIGDQVSIKALQLPGYTYVWQDSTAGPAILADKEGWYVVTMTNQCGVQKDSVFISQRLCDCRHFFPNAFTPNADGHNDKIGAYVDCDTRNFELAIFNRWGNKVFFTNDQHAKWDGVYENEPCDMATYYYYFKFESPRGEEFFEKGSIQLLR